MLIALNCKSVFMLKWPFFFYFHYQSANYRLPHGLLTFDFHMRVIKNCPCALQIHIINIKSIHCFHGNNQIYASPFSDTVIPYSLHTPIYKIVDIIPALFNNIAVAVYIYIFPGICRAASLGLLSLLLFPNYYGSWVPKMIRQSLCSLNS